MKRQKKALRHGYVTMLMAGLPMWSGCAEAPRQPAGEVQSIEQQMQPSPAPSARDTQWQQAFTAGKAAADAGRDAEAERALQAALKIAREGGAHDTRLAESLTQLGDFYLSRQREAQAGPLLAEALPLWEKLAGTTDAHTATLLNNLGVV